MRGGSCSCLVCGKALQAAELGLSVEVQVHDGAGRPLHLDACPGGCAKRLLDQVVEVERRLLRRQHQPVSQEAAQLARDLRQPRRTRAGERPKSWQQIADELVLAHHPRHEPEDVRDAVAALPAETSAEAAELARVEESFRAAWADEFPGEPWPGMEAARRRFRLKHTHADSGGKEAASI